MMIDIMGDALCNVDVSLLSMSAYLWCWSIWELGLSVLLMEMAEQ